MARKRTVRLRTLPPSIVLSPSRRKLRRTRNVQLVDEDGRVKEDFLSTPSRKDVREHSASICMFGLFGGGPLKTPRNSSIRILDAMGHELEEPSEQNGSEDAVIEACYTPQEALEQMKKAVADLREGLNSVDTSGEGPLDDPQLGELVAGSAGHTKQVLYVTVTSTNRPDAAQISVLERKNAWRKSRFLPNFLPRVKSDIESDILNSLRILGHLFQARRRTERGQRRCSRCKTF
ncbi:hypothetical protein EDB87DRAFT_503098 [Lactarius vividus]|nr:hypothetical protein EDB87DRAFT_503098 [Lactarius vividus]